MRSSLHESRRVLPEAGRPRLLSADGSAAAPQPAGSPPALSKSGLAWLGLRLIGLLFLAKTFAAAYGLVLQLGMIFNIFTVASLVGAQPGEQTYRLWISALLTIAQLVLFGFLSYYFLRQGKAVYRLLMFERRLPAGPAA